MVNAVEKCCIPNCKRPYRSKGYCNVHFKKWRRGELEAKPRYKTCGEENCRKPMFKQGLCEDHYKAWATARKGAAAASAVAPAAPEAAPPASEEPAAQ